MFVNLKIRFLVCIFLTPMTVLMTVLKEFATICANRLLLKLLKFTEPVPSFDLSIDQKLDVKKF